MTTSRFKKQHRAVGIGMSLKAWAAYVSGGTSIFSQHAVVWRARKGLS